MRELVDGDGPGVLVLEGEAGIGKTTLVDVACARAARAGLIVHRAAAEGPLPAPALTLLDDVLGSRRSRDAPSERATAGELEAVAGEHLGDLVVATLDALEAASARSPLLVALDDLQWADAASLAVLGPVLRRSPAIGVRWILATRPVPRPPLLLALFDELRSGSAECRRVPPLSSDDIRRLAELELGQVGEDTLRLLEQAGGNPFFVHELLAARSAGRGPGSLVEAVAIRLRAAGDDVTEVLRVAAVLGRTVRPDDVAAVAGLPLAQVADALTDATDAELLAPDSDQLTFRHDVVREALLVQTPPAVQRALHRRAAEVLDGRSAPPEQVVRHLAAGAERGDRAVIATLRAAAAASVPTLNADLLLTALDHCDPTDPQRPELALETADALMWAGRPREALDVTAAALASDATPLVAHELRACRSHALFTAGDPAAAVLTWQQDRDRAASDRPIPPLEWAELALARLFSGDAAAARHDAATALAGEASGLAAATARSVLAWLDASAGDLVAAREHADAAVHAGAEATDTPNRRGGAGHRSARRYSPDLIRAAVADAAGDSTTVATSLVAARRQIDHDGMAVLEPLVFAVQAVHELRTGRWDDALASADAGTAAMADAGVRLVANWLAAVRALILLDRDDPNAAALALEEGAEPGVPLGQDWVVLARARLGAAAGDRAAACAQLGGVVELLVGAGARSCLSFTSPDLARLVVATGDEERRRWLSTTLADLTERAGEPMLAAAAAARAVLDGDPVASEAAAARLEATDRPVDAAWALADAAIACAEAEPDRARDLARRAASGFAAVGAERPVDTMRALLRASGVRFRAPSAATGATVGWDALTATERRIVALVAAGGSNAAIAEQLVVSRRTVESHLVRVYRKLGLRSRVELVRAATERSSGPATEPDDAATS